MQLGLSSGASFAVALGVVVRLAWCAVAARQPEWFGDPFAYLNHARDIADGVGYVVWLDGAPTAYYPVGYPAVLGGALWLVQSVTRSEALVPTIVGVNLAASIAIIVLTHALAARLGGPRVARLAALVVALFPSLVLYTATAHLELVFTALVLLVVFLALDARTPARLVALGAALGAATLVRPVVLPMLLVAVAWWARELADVRAALRRAAVVGGVAVLVLLPWTVRSSGALDGLVLVSTNTGDNLCIGHSPQSDGQYHHLDEWCWSGFDDVPRDRLEVERDRTNRADALEYAVEHPGRELWLLWRKAFHLVSHDHEGLYAVESYGEDEFLTDAQRTTIRWVADLWYYAAVAAAIAGVIVARRRHLDASGVLLWAAVVLLAVPLLFFGGSRFHLPALPFVAVFAAVALARLRTVAV